MRPKDTLLERFSSNYLGQRDRESIKIEVLIDIRDSLDRIWKSLESKATKE